MSSFDKAISEIVLLCEKTRRRTIPKSKIKKRSEKSRKEKAKNVEIDWLGEESKSSGEVTRHTFTASSKEKTEADKHQGFVEVFNKSGRIDNISCDCSDFQASYKTWRNKEGVSGFKEGVKPINDYFDPHTRDNPETMNKDNTGYCCKHLIKAIEKLP